MAKSVVAFETVSPEQILIQQAAMASLNIASKGTRTILKFPAISLASWLEYDRGSGRFCAVNTSL